MNLLTKIVELQALTEFLSSQVYQVSPDKRAYVREAAINSASTKTKIEMWNDYGAKTFILSRDLIEAFQHTDVPMELFPHEFGYPFQCFTIEGETPLFETNMGYININGQRIGRNLPASVYTLLYIEARYIEKKADKYIRPDGTEAQGLEWNRALTAFFPGEHNVGLETIVLNMRDDMTILNTTETKKEGLLITQLEKVDARNIVNVFYNTIMYINDPTRILAETEEYRRRKVKLKGRKKAVKTGYIYLKPPKEYVPLSKSSQGRKLEKRFIVRGHYRKQAHGPKWSEHKRIWIKPFWKGPEWAERLSKAYKVE